MNTSSPIKSEEDYVKAQKHASDAQLLFVELIPLLNANLPHHVIEIQSAVQNPGSCANEPNGCPIITLLFICSYDY